MSLRSGLNPASEIKSLRTIAKIGKIADIAGKALGAVATVEHGMNAIKAFKNGDIGYGLLNTAKVGLVIFFMFAKANPLILTGSLVYAAVDLATTKDE